jgi:hypothetical protein
MDTKLVCDLLNGCSYLTYYDEYVGKLLTGSDMYQFLIRTLKERENM